MLGALRRLGRVPVAAAASAGIATYCAARISAPSLCDAGAKPGAPAPPVSAPSPDGWAGAGLWESLQSAAATAKEKVHENLIAPFTEASQEILLPPLPARMRGKELPTLVVALDDVLIHSKWDRQYGWRYVKRPGADEFLRALAPYYEIVVWTEQFSMMESVIAALDKYGAIRHRLYKDGMVYRNGRHVKDLKHVNRDLAKTVVLDCREANATQQPDNYLILPPFTVGDDAAAEPSAGGGGAAAADTALIRHVPFLLNLARLAYVRKVDVRCARARAARAARSAAPHAASADRALA